MFYSKTKLVPDRQVKHSFAQESFTKNLKYEMVMLRGCFHGYGPTCQLHIRPKMKVDVLSFQMIYAVALCRLNF